jgi:hypothetical protein
MATWPTAAQLEEFLAGPADQPVVMLNLLEFKQQADPSHPDMSGRDAVLLYSRAMRGFVEARGGSFVLAAHVDSQLIGVPRWPPRSASTATPASRASGCSR